MGSLIHQVISTNVRSNLGSKEERLQQLIESISSITTEMLVLMPALACNCLGENFFGDIIIFRDSPSMRALNNSKVFDQLQETAARFKVYRTIS